jgi:hypothetical protein
VLAVNWRPALNVNADVPSATVYVSAAMKL